MKTLKFTLIAAIVACTMISPAYADGGAQEKKANKKIVNINYEKAITNPGLVTAMYQQVSMDDLLHSQGHILVIDVLYQGNIYRIKGTLDQWFRFFMRGGLAPVSKATVPAIDE